MILEYLPHALVLVLRVGLTACALRHTVAVVAFIFAIGIDPITIDRYKRNALRAAIYLSLASAAWLYFSLKYWP